MLRNDKQCVSELCTMQQEWNKKQTHAVIHKNTLRWCISGAVFAAISTCGMKEKEKKNPIAPIAMSKH